MNREIKFRGWLKPRWEEDEDANKMYYDIQNSYDTLGDVKPYDPMTDFREWIDDDIAVVEQYTGLKDKNDKEIYEGDIVRTTDRVTVDGSIFPVGVVEFKQQAFWICNVPSDRPDFTHNETLLQYWETDLEIIGNIHENPELLEEGK